MSVRAPFHRQRCRQQKKSKKISRWVRFEALEDRRLLAPLLGSSPAETNRRELVIVDVQAPDYRQLLGGLNVASQENPEVVFLDSHTDGVLAIQRLLSERSDLDAVHIFSHGQPGAVQLGSTWLSSSTLPDYAAAIRGWSAALRSGGDILLYGCDIAADSAGQSLIGEIHDLTGADVAASTNETGSAALGGDWTLEFTAGPIETPIVVSPAAQADWDHVLAPQTFAPGSYIVDMGQSTQTVGNALKPYGLVYDLVTNFQVPVSWAINPTKTTFRLDAGDAIPIDFTATTTSGPKSYSGGSFIIDAALVTPAIASELNTWKAQGVVIDQTDPLAPPLATEIYGQVTSFPRAVLDAQNGKLAVPYYANAGVPASSYRIGDPTDLNQCDDVYILPHADPQDWIDAWKQGLFSFVTGGGGLWAGCHSASALESLTSFTVGGSTQRLNFLSNDLVPWTSHSAGTPPYTYNAAAANDPEMQIMNRLDAATTNGSEQIYVPAATGWRSTTTVAAFDPDHPNNPVGGTSPFNKAAVVAYGNAFGNPASGLVMYEAGHSLAGNAAANIAAQRAFFNFILTEGILNAPQPAVNIPTIVPGQAATITATISGGSGHYSYQWVSANGGIFSTPTGTWNVGDSPITTQYLLTAAKDTVRLLVTDTCNRHGIFSASLADAPPTIDLDANNSSGATGADYHGFFQGGVIVPAADTDTLITDNGTTIHSAVIQLTTRPDGSAETLLIDEALAASLGISVTPDGNGGFLLSGTATLAQYQQVIASLEYVDSLPFPTSTDRVITVTVNDGISDSNTATSRLSFLGGAVTTVEKQLYLSDPGQGMDRIDPVASNDDTTSTVSVVPVVSTNSTGLAVWSNSARKNLEYRPWNLTAYGTQATTPTDGGSYITMSSAASPKRNESIVVGVTSDRHVSGSIWNGSSWTPISITVAGKVKQNLGAPSQSQWWGAAVAYETNSGRALLVWNTGSTLNYSIWNGTSWTAAATIPVYTGVEPRQIRIASNPLAGSNEIVITVTDKSEVDRALVWDGSTWVNQTPLDSNTGHNFTDANVAYEQQSGRAMVVYASGTMGAVGYRLWDGTAWSAANTISAVASSNGFAQWTAIAGDPNSNRIVLGVESSGDDAWMNVWSGSAWGTSTLGTNNTVTNQNNQNIAVAFESTSGDALVVYQNDENTNTTELQFRTFTGGVWSAGTNFGSFGNHETVSITLSSNPYSDQVQLLVNDDAKMLRSELWNGSSFAAPIPLESNTNTNTGQPFSFVWDRFAPGTVTTTTTFTQTTGLISPLVLPTGSDVHVTTFIQLTSGTLPAAPKLSVRLGVAGSPILTIPAPPTVTPLGSGMFKLEWTGTLPTNVTVPADGQLSLTLIDFDSTYSFNVLYDSSSFPSQIEFATATGITVSSLGVFGAAFPGGSPIATTEAGQEAFVRFTVSDPFGAADITGADLLIENSQGGTVLTTPLTDANVVASTPGSKTYEFEWTPLTGDKFTITVTAHEGTEGVTATAQTTITATARPDLVVAKSDAGATVNAGGSVAYTINFSNAGLADATGVVLTEFLPAGSTFNPAASTPGWVTVGSGQFRFPVGTLAAGAAGSVTFAVTALNPVPATLEQLENTVQIADDGTHGADEDPSNNTGTDSTPVLAAPDLVITKTDGGTSTLAGGIVLYQISYANVGTQDAIGVVIQETLPANTTFNPTYSVGGWEAEVGNLFNLDVGDLPAGASGVATFAVTVNNPLPGGVTQILNTALISDGGSGGADPNPGNNTSTDTTPIANNPQADLQITKTDNLSTATPGGAVTYTIAVTNAGPNAVTGASFSDVVPAALTGVSFTSMVGGGASAVPPGGSGNTITGLLNLPVGGTVTYTVTGTLDPAAIGTLTNVATVLPPAGILDPNTGNNTAIDTDPIVPVSDLSLDKTFAFTDLDGSGTLTPGDQIVFTITVTNSGPNPAHNVTVIDPLASGYFFASDDAAVSGGSYAPGSGLWTIGSIGATAPNNTAVLHLTATVGASGNSTNAAEVASSDSRDPDSTPNNSEPGEDDIDTVTPVLQPKSDLSLAKTMALTSDVDTNGILSIGDRVTFTLTLTNQGPNPAASVHVADLLPAGYTFFSLTPPPSQGSYASATGDWNLGLVNVLATATLNIVATITSGKPASAYTNYAQVSASGSFDPDSTPGNNSTTEDDDATARPLIADLSVSKTVDFAPGGDLDANGTPSTGDQIIFTVSIANAGPDFATGVKLLDKLATGYTYDDDDSGGTYDPLSGVWLVGAMAPDTTQTLNITATINASGVFSNTAQVSASEHFDPDSKPNNSLASEDDQATVTLVPGAAAQPPVAVNDSSLHNPPGPVTLNITDNDSDPNLDLAVNTVDLDPGAAGTQTTRTIAGQGSWTVDSEGNVTFTPLPTFTLDPSPINYTVKDSGGRTSNQASITIDYVPVASNDSSSGNTTGTAVSVPVLTNDTTGDTPVPATVQIVGTPGPGVSLGVPGEGTWSVNAATGAITFTPAPGFTGDPTPIQYTVQDNDGNTSNPATVTIDYVQFPPVAVNDASLHNPPGPVTLNVTANDTDPNGDLDPITVDLDPATPGQQTLHAVPGEGLWTVDSAGNVTFQPEVGFTEEPTPITYTVNDRTGLVSNPATITIGYLPAIQVVKTAGPASVPETGGSVTYTYAVTNTSPAGATDPLSGVVLADSDGTPLLMSGDLNLDSQLDAGETWLYELTVTLADQNTLSSHVNTVTATAHDDEGDLAAATATATVTFTNAAPSITVDKTAPAAVVEGNKVNYGFTITNTSPASTDPVTITSVVDNVLGDLTSAANAAWIAQGHSGAIILVPGATFTFSFMTAAVLNAGTVVNLVTVSGHDDENTPATASDTATVIVTNATPSIAVDKTAPASVTEGNTVTYTFTITNTSPASTDPVTITSVVDNVLGDLTAVANSAWITQGHSGAIILVKGASFTFSFTTASVLNAGTVVNTVTVSGHDDEDTPATASDSASVNVTNATPSIVIDKTGPTTVAEGGSVTYVFTITNISPAGTDPVTITSVVDDVLGNLIGAANSARLLQGRGNGPIILAPGESFTFTFTTTFAAAGTVVNTVTASGHDDENTPVGDTDNHTLIVSDEAPVITVDKFAPLTVPEGSTVTYGFTITNASPAATETVTITSVVDDVLGNLTAAANAAWVAQGHMGAIVLAQGQSFSFGFTTPTAVNAGPVVNTVTVAGQDDEGDPASATDSALVIVTNVAPSITVDKTGPASIAEGGTATYGFTIVNTSPVSTDPVTITSVADDTLGDLTAAAQAAWLAQGHSGAILLAPGQGFTFSFTTAAAQNAGTVVNTVSVLGHDDENTPTSDQDNHTLTVNNAAPSITVDKSGPLAAAEGNTVTYGFTITNTSLASTDPVTITSVSDNVLGDLFAAASSAWIAQGHSGPIVLARGDSFLFNYTTTAALDAGTVVNTVTVSGHDDENTPATATDTHTVTVTNAAPSISVDKSGPATVAEDNTTTFSFTITNTSPASTDAVTITSVSDDVLGDLTAAANAAWLAQGHSGPIVLKPGENFTFSFTTATVLNAGAVTNTVTVSGHDNENTPATAQDGHTLSVTDVAPSLTVAKSAPPSVVEGNVVTYTFTITNTSSASTDPLTITSVVDSVLGDLTADLAAAWAAQGHLGAVILAPGQPFTFSVATAAVLDAGTVVNVVTVIGHDDEGTSASASDSATVTVTNATPSITVDKTAPASVVEGNFVTYNFTITNTSLSTTEAVTITSVIDNVLGDLTAAANGAWTSQGNSGAIVLDQGGSFAFSFTTTAVLNAGLVTNTVTVSGHDDENTPATAVDTATVNVTNATPTISVDKTGPATIAEGSTATYGFTITNTSAASTDPLTITVVSDSVLGNLLPAANAAWIAQGHSTPIVLAPGQSFTFSVSTAALNAGTVANTVTVTGLDDENTSTSATDNHTLIVSNQAPVIVVDKTAPATIAEGNTTTYSFTISNVSPAGTETVTITSVVDDVLGDLTAAASAAWLAQGHTGAILLAPGQLFSFSFTTLTALDAGTIVNTVSVAGQDDEGDPAGATDTATVVVTNVAPSISVDKTGPATIGEGNTATYGFTILNTSQSSTDPVTVTSVIDNVLGDLTSAASAAWLAQGHSGAIVLAPGQRFSFSLTTIAALNAGTVINTILVSGHDNENTPTSANDTHTVTVTGASPAIDVAKSGPATISEGNVAAFDFVITISNQSTASTDPVTITSVSDDKLGDLTGAANAAWTNQGHSVPIVLQPGDSFTFSYTITAAFNAGTVVNTVSVSGHDDENTPVNGQDSHTLVVSDVTPSIAVDKSGPTTVAEGQTATYSFAITNTSSANTDPVTITSVNDDVLGDLTAAANAAWIAQGHSGPIVLAQGQNFTFTFTTAVLATGTVANQVTVSGHDDENSPVSGQDGHLLTVTDVAPSITVLKTAPPTVAEGSTVTYSFAITNTSLASTDPVTIAAVVDSVLGDLTSAANAAWTAQGHSGAILLAPGGSFSFAFTTTNVLNAGTVINQVTVSGHDDEDTPVSASDTATVTVTNVTPSLTVDKTAPATIVEGNTVTYGFAITNTSPASTDPVTVTSVNDNVLGSLTAAANAAWLAQGHSGAIVLAPGDTFSFSVTTAMALNVGTVQNTVTVSGHDDENTPVNAGDSASVIVTNAVPSITVDKTGPTTIAEGLTATYGFTITNTSPASTDPVTITSVNDTVLGDLFATATAAWLAQGHMGPIILAPGQFFTFTFTTAALNPSAVINLVTVAGHDDENTPVLGQDVHRLTVSDLVPVITVDKSGPATIVEGNTATYSFTITNTTPAASEPVTITSVVDDVLGDLTAAANAAWIAQGHMGPIVLTPDQAFTFTFISAALNAGTLVNTVSVSGQDDEGNPAGATDTATVNVTNATPSIAVDKTGPTSIAEGNTATYGFTITNTSPASTDPVTITSVIDNVFGNLTAAAQAAWLAQGHNGAITLAPSQVFSFSVTTAALDAGTVNNTVIVSGHDDENTPATAQDSHSLIVANVSPTIVVEKTGPATIAEGTASFDFVITISNESTASTDPVTIDSVVDDKLGNLTGAATAAWIAQGHSAPIVLQPGDSFSFSFTTNTPLNAGTVVNTVTVLGHDNEGTTTTGQDDHTLIVSDATPSIAVDKLGPTTIAENNQATYSFTITNTSPADTDPVTIDSVTDSVLGDLTATANAAWVALGNSTPIVLDQDEEFTFTFTTGFVLNAGTVVNLVTVSGHDDEGSPASAQDTHTLTVTNVAPSITVDKTGPATIAEGNAVTYTFTITNTSPAGTDPVTITSVTDNVLGDLTAAASSAWAAQGHLGAIVLAPSQVFTFSFTTAVLGAGTVINLVTVSGHDDEETPTSATDGHNLTVANQTPAITVDKSGPGSIVHGQTATYVFTITNTSPASTDPVTVTSILDNQLGELIGVATAANGGNPIVLLPGQSFRFTATSGVLNSISVVNVVTVQAHDNENTNATASDDATVTVNFPPVAVDDSSLNNPPGPVTLNVTSNDSDPNGDLVPSTVDLDPATPGQQTVLVVAGQGTWTVDAAGNVTFTPQAGFTHDPTPIHYTVSDATGLVSNVATITVDYALEPPIIVLPPDKSPRVPAPVLVLDSATGQVQASFLAYGPTFLGGTRAVTADLTGDGIDEIITAPGRGRTGEIRVFTQQGVELPEFRTLAYPTSYTGGVSVAVADVNGDGLKDIITGPSSGKAEIRVFLNQSPNLDPIANTPAKKFLAFPTSVVGGVTVRAADVGQRLPNGTFVNTPDGKAEIFVGSGPGTKATIKVFDVSGTPTAVRTIYPFSTNTSIYKNGVNFDVVRLNTGDQIPDLIVGSENGGNSRVETFVWNTASASLAKTGSFMAFGNSPSKIAPVRVAGLDSDGDDVADQIATVQGPNGTTQQVRIYDILNINPLTVQLNSALSPFPGPYFIAAINNPGLPPSTMERGEGEAAVMAAKDALLTMNYINQQSSPPASRPSANLFDVNGDGRFTAADVLALNRRTRQADVDLLFAELGDIHKSLSRKR